MRKLMYVLFGLVLFAGAAGLLYMRQMQTADESPAATAQQQTEAQPGARGLRPNGPDRKALQEQRGERRFERGLRQYRNSTGGWNTFQAAIDILNVVVGLVGIGLALSGMRMRRQAKSGRDA